LNSRKFNVHVVLFVQVLSCRIVQSIKAVKADPNPDPSVPSIHNHPDDVCTIYNLLENMWKEKKKQQRRIKESAHELHSYSS